MQTFTAHLNDYPTQKFDERLLVTDAEALCDTMKVFSKLVNLAQQMTVEKGQYAKITARLDMKTPMFAESLDIL